MTTTTYSPVSTPRTPSHGECTGWCGTRRRAGFGGQQLANVIERSSCCWNPRFAAGVPTVADRTGTVLARTAFALPAGPERAAASRHAPATARQTRGDATRRLAGVFAACPLLGSSATSVQSLARGSQRHHPSPHTLEAICTRARWLMYVVQSRQTRCLPHFPLRYEEGPRFCSHAYTHRHACLSALFHRPLFGCLAA